jgi:hypothetical protein
MSIVNVNQSCTKEVCFTCNYHSSGYSVNISQFDRKVFCQPSDTIGRRSYGYTRWSECGSERIQTTCGKKTIEEQKRQDHYEILTARIFVPLRDVNLVVEDVNDPQDRLKLAYSISHLESLPDYDYAEQHMNQDLPAELIKPKDLQMQVEQLNLDIDDYFNNKLPEIIVNTLTSNLGGITVVNSVDTLPEHTMSYYYLRQKLNRYWVEKLDFEVRCDSGFCKLNGGRDLANISVQP